MGGPHLPQPTRPDHSLFKQLLIPAALSATIAADCSSQITEFNTLKSNAHLGHMTHEWYFLLNEKLLTTLSVFTVLSWSCSAQDNTLWHPLQGKCGLFS
jgi:hypothetical protein